MAKVNEVPCLHAEFFSSHRSPVARVIIIKMRISQSVFECLRQMAARSSTETGSVGSSNVLFNSSRSKCRFGIVKYISKVLNGSLLGQSVHHNLVQLLGPCTSVHH